MNIKKLSEINISDLPYVGGKNASLGEMIKNLTKIGIKIPDGYAVTTTAYNKFIEYNNLKCIIDYELEKVDIDNLSSLRNCGSNIRYAIKKGIFPENLKKDIISNYHELNYKYNTNNVDVAIRSSSTAEDLKEASFAGQQESFLNISGSENILNYIIECFASLYTDRAISYRKTINYEEDLDISVCVQKMVRSDLACSGVSFSIDPDTGLTDVITINGTYGLGELLVQGNIIPDEFIVYKHLLNDKNIPIIDKKIGDKNIKMIYNKDLKSSKKTSIVNVCDDEKNKFCLNEKQIIQLANYVKIIEEYYSSINNCYTPVDIEWALDGIDNNIYIVQARPETVQSSKKSIIQYKIENNNIKPILSGIAVGDKITTGCIRIINSLEEYQTNMENIIFNKGDILVTDITDPDWEPLMSKASAIITNKGGRTSHCAIIARELGIVAIVGTHNCTDVLKNGINITASCAEGDVGYIYKGQLEYTKTEINLKDLPKVKTNILLNIGSPDFKNHIYRDIVKGVGLVRLEFIINNFIKIHPLALLNYNNLDKELKTKIDKLIIGFDNPIDYFIKKLSYGISRIAAMFYPNNIIVRFSDFKTNEYKNLLGGYNYEPDEENPMLGWRGASRYYSDAYKNAFGLECKAINYIRNIIGLNNVTVMIPFCRTVKECILVQDIMALNNLRREDGLKVYLMCEIPSNVILADKFCKYVDGFSIGSNDLTQLTLGIDRDSSNVANIGDARDEAVREMILIAIQKCKKNNTKIGICGQAPSDYPEFATFLVENGIDTISITPDSLLKTLNAIYNIENILLK